MASSSAAATAARAAAVAAAAAAAAAARELLSASAPGHLSRPPTSSLGRGAWGQDGGEGAGVVGGGARGRGASSTVAAHAVDSWHE